MERSVALKKLGKMLGKSFGYRFDPKAPDKDGRAEAREEQKTAVVIRDELSKQKDDRMRILLQGDAEFQRLKSAYKEAQRHCDKLLSISGHYRVTVGVSNSIFFVVKAQGDSWEEVIAKLTEKAPA